MQSWSPYYEKDKKLLEAVQQRAIRMTSGLTGTYEQKLAQVGLTTLGDRRVRGDLIQTYKVLHQVDDIPVSTFFEVAGAHHSHSTRLADPTQGESVSLNLMDSVTYGETSSDIEWLRGGIPSLLMSSGQQM